MLIRKYYSVRSGINTELNKLDIGILHRLFYSAYSDFESRGYFQESLGFYCTESEDRLPGKIGTNIDLYFLRKLRKSYLWPLQNYSDDWTGKFVYREDDIFDLIELLFDLISKPIDGQYHSWNDCGWHYTTFDKNSGQKEWKASINEFLFEYENGYELTNNGEVVSLGESGLRHLFEAPKPKCDPHNVQLKLDIAINKYRNRHSSRQERKDAVRELADVLEYLRPQIKDTMLTKDEKDLFNIANNFAIRHHNESQKSDYDANWLSWIFYVYLATIHLVLRLIERNDSASSN